MWCQYFGKRKHINVPAQKVMLIFFCRLCHYKETSVKITARYDNIYHDTLLVYLKG